MSKRAPVIIIGVGLLVAIAVVFGVRSCTRDDAVVMLPSPPARATFEPSQPFAVEVFARRPADGAAADVEWLESELVRLLRLRKLDAARAHAGSTTNVHLLRIAVDADSGEALLALVAPDQVLERERALAVQDASRLGLVRALAIALPGFLGAPRLAAEDLDGLLGVNDAKAYDAFTRAASEILGPDSQGFTRPPSTAARARTIDRLEALVRAQPRFARARALLAVAYLSLGGEDEASLARLATLNAERVLGRDANVPEGHAALGLAALRGGEWIRAQEHFEAALRLDPDNAPALEGLACLLADAGLYEAALPLAKRAAALQPRNIGARECLTYVDESPTIDPDAHAAAAEVYALRAILRGDLAEGERALRGALPPAHFARWAQPVLRAAAHPAQIPQALRAVTRAANDGEIEASTEILCGAALRQGDFVLNRMARLQREERHTPLRILWLKDATFLRKHPRFDEIISNAGLPTFWQEHGAPDICVSEPDLEGCGLGAAVR